MNITDTEFGLMLLVVGMGGTMLTLGALTLLIKGITMLLPPSKPTNDSPKA